MFGGGRKRHAIPTGQKQWLAVLWHTWVHHRAVSVFLDVPRPSLNVAPDNLHCRATDFTPSIEAIQSGKGLRGRTRGDHVHESISVALAICHVGGDIKKIVEVGKTSPIKYST